MNNLKKTLKKSTIAFVALTTILWSVSGVLLAPLPAQAAVTVLSENRIMGSMSMGSGFMRDVAAFKITSSTAGEKLAAINVRLEDIGGASEQEADANNLLAPFEFPSPATPTDNQGLSIYYDFNQNGMFDPSTDTVLAWGEEPAWSETEAGKWDVTLNIADHDLSSSHAGNWNYFVHMKMASSPAAGKSFKFTFPADAIVTTVSSPTITQFSTNPINSTGGGSGTMYESPHVMNVRVSMNVQTSASLLAVEFDRNMNSATTNCNNDDDPDLLPPCTNIYTLYTKSANDDHTINSAALGGDSRTVVITALNAKAAPTFEDYLTISTDPRYAPKSADGISFQDPYPMQLTMRWSDLKISEVQITGASGTATEEFIELYNSSSSANTSQFLIYALHNGSVITPPLASILANTIDSYHFYLIGNGQEYAGSLFADGNFSLGEGVDLDNDDAILLFEMISGIGWLVDAVGWGDTATAASAIYAEGNALRAPANGQSLERKAAPSSTPATMAAGGSDALGGNGYDSDDNSYDFVVRTSSDPQNSGVTETFQMGGGGYTNSPPSINHMPLSMAMISQELKVPAQIYDVEDTFANLTYKRLCYKRGDQTWPSNPEQEVCVTGQMVYDVIFTIPASAVTITGIDYYLHVQDSAGNDSYNASSPTANTIDLARQYAYHINVLDSTHRGIREISGTVYQNDCETGINNATVYVEGLGQNTTTSTMDDVDGSFRLTGLPDGVYNLRATAMNYMESTIWGVSVNDYNQISSGWAFCLQSGSGGQGGDSVGPQVIWTAPNEGMMGAPTDIVIDRAPILIGFDQALDENKFTGGSGTAHVKLKKRVNEDIPVQDVPGYAVYLENTPAGESINARGVSFDAPGASATTPVVVIDMVALLEQGTDYIVEILPTLTDAAGNPVSGNRPGGGHSFMFTTMNSEWNFGATSGGGFGSFEDEGFWMGGDFSQMMNDTTYGIMAGKYTAGTGKWTGGQYNPPYIFGSVPGPGSWNMATNLDLIVFEFSEPIDENTVNKANFKLYSVASNGTETDLTSSKIASVDLSTSKTFVTMNVVAAGLAEGDYRVKVMSGVRGASGITLGDPNHPEWEHFRSDFNVGSSADSTAPAIVGSYPDNDPNGLIAVPLDFGFVNIGFSESLNPSSVTSQTASLKLGSTTVPTTVEYDIMAQSIKLFPTSGLMPGGKYTVALTNGISDLAGQALVAVNRTFTMSTNVDTTQPRVEFANCDDYTCAITFSKPMNATRASDGSVNAAKWNASVLKPGNFSLRYGPIGDENTVVDLTATGISFQYDYEGRTLSIEGWSGSDDIMRTAIHQISSPHFLITVTGVKDIMDNPIDTTNSNNIAKGPLGNSADTMGFVGMGGGGFMGAPSASGGGAMMGAGGGMGMTSTGFGGHMATDMGMMPVSVFPMNSLAGLTTTYFIDFPISTDKYIDNGGYLKLTFPTGFNVASAIPDTYNPNNKDFNMMGPDTVTWGTTGSDGITVSGQTVNIYFDITDTNSDGAKTGNPDFLHIEIKNIVNSTIPKDFNTSGYTVDMKSYKADGTLQESKTSMPFFISEAGTNNITISPLTVTGGTGVVTLMMGSPMTGPMDLEVTLVNGTITAVDGNAQDTTVNWSNLPDGCYNIFTEPTITLGGNRYQGQMNPEPLCLPVYEWDSNNWANWNAGTKTLTKPVTFTKLDTSNSAVLTAIITGNFGADEDIDVFAFGPGGGMVETLNNVGPLTAYEVQLYLPQNGYYSIGMGPAMPKGPMMGPPPMPDWMPPMNISVEVSGVGSTPVIKRTDTQQTVTSLGFTVATASLQINGKVVDNSGNAISNAELWAYQPFGFGGMGSHTQSKANGEFTLKVAEVGSYKVGAFLPGMGDAPETAVDVRNEDDNVEVAEIYVNGRLTTGTTGDNPFLLKILKPDYTISGKVSNSSGTAIQYAHLMATETTTNYITHTGTDSEGNYILYVSAGTWTITADMPSGTDTCGILTKQVTVSSSTGSLSNQNIRPDATTVCYTISGTVTISGTAQANIPVMVETWDTTNDRPSGGYHRNEMTDSNGVYRVKAGNNLTYRVSTWSPEYGEIGKNVTITNGVVSDANITYSADSMKTLTVTYTGGAADMQGFLEAKSTTGSTRRGLPINGLVQSQTLTLPADTYNVFTHVKGIGGFSDTADLTQGDDTVTFNLSTTTIRTITGTVLDENSTALKGAVVTITNETTGLQTSATTNSSGAYTAKVKDGSYSIKAGKSGYSTPAKATLTVSGNVDYDFDSDIIGEDVAVDNDLTKNTLSLSGTIYEASTNWTTPGVPEAVTEGVVYATSSDGKFAKTDIKPDGTYELGVSAGTWTVVGDSTLHAATTDSTPVTVSASNATDNNVTLTADATDVKKSATRTVTPSVGATFDNTENTGLKAVFGQNVLGRDSNPGSVIMETIDAPDTELAVPLADDVVAVQAKDNSDKAITQLSGNGAEITMKYTDAELSAAGVSESQLKLSYYDDTGDAWVELDSTVDTTNNTITGYITHLTTIGITHPPVTPPSQGRSHRNDTPSGGTTTGDTGGTTGGGGGGSADTGENVTTETPAEETPLATTEETKLVLGPRVVLPQRAPAPDLVKEGQALGEFTKLVNRLPATSADWQVVNYLTYGTEAVAKVHINERKNLLNEYKESYGHVPATEAEWTNIDHISRGENPTIRNLTREGTGLKSFTETYGRLPSTDNDWNFVRWVSYKLRTPARDLTKEKAAIGDFRLSHKGRLPSTQNDWAVVRALAYGEATAIAQK